MTQPAVLLRGYWVCVGIVVDRCVAGRAACLLCEVFTCQKLPICALGAVCCRSGTAIAVAIAGVTHEGAVGRRGSVGVGRGAGDAVMIVDAPVVRTQGLASDAVGAVVGVNAARAARRHAVVAPQVVSVRLVSLVV